jgi:5-methylcytosine-specific restriction endonuclease McrA
MSPLVCHEPGCPNFRPCSLHSNTERREPTHPNFRPIATQPAEHRSPSSVRTSTHAWQKRIRPFVLARDRYRCHWCHVDLLTLKPHERQVDHLDPVSKGGTDDPSTLVAACGPCNNRRGNR